MDTTTHTKSNVATIQAIYEAFGRGDIPFILDQMADNVAWDHWDDNSSTNAGVPWMQPRQGKDGVLEFFGLMAAMEIADFQVLHFLDGGSKVVAEVLIEVNLPQSGAHYRDEELHLWTIDEAGKVCALRHYTDTAKHINAARASMSA